MNPRSRISIFDTFTARRTITRAQLGELVNFLIFNRNCKLGGNDVRTLLATKPLTNTVVGNLFNRTIELQKTSLFSFIKIPKMNASFPEVITYTHVTPDLKQLDVPTEQHLYEAISQVPEFANTICFNVTTMLRGSGEPIDLLGFQSIVIRDLLSRSYFDNQTTMWLTPSLIRYLCRFYNMSLSASIGSVYNLTFQEQQVVATIVSLFFLQKVSDTSTAEAFIKSTKLGLGSQQEISDIISALKDALGADYANMDLDGVCLGIRALGTSRLSSINRLFLYTRLKGIGPDTFTSTMALEYPPYWAYLVLLTLSGRKMGLLSTFKKNDLQKEAGSFADDIARTYSFLPAL